MPISGLSRWPWYGQIGACVAVAALAVAGFFTYYAQPVQQRLADQASQLAAVRGDILRAQATARRLPQFRADVARLEQRLDRLRPVLPEEKDVADLLRRIQGMATESRLVIRAFTPRPVAPKAIHVEWPIAIEFEGTYHDVGHFLARVSAFPRIINVTDIEVHGKDKPAPGGATVTVRCTATTFVLSAAKDPAPAASTGKPAPAGRASVGGKA
jgi:type IV pilus assembly protein PilO